MTRDSRLKREAPRREAGSARKGESGGAEGNRTTSGATPTLGPVEVTQEDHEAALGCAGEGCRNAPEHFARHRLAHSPLTERLSPDGEGLTDEQIERALEAWYEAPGPAAVRMRVAIRSALTAHAQARPDVPPREPSVTMIEAAVDNCGPIGCCNLNSTDVREIWLTMHDAATIARIQAERDTAREDALREAAGVARNRYAGDRWAGSVRTAANYIASEIMALTATEQLK